MQYKYEVVYVEAFDMCNLPKMLAARYPDWKIAFIAPCVEESDKNIHSEDKDWGRREKRITTVGFHIILEKDNQNNPPT